MFLLGKSIGFISEPALLVASITNSNVVYNQTIQENTELYMWAKKKWYKWEWKEAYSVA